MPDKAQIIIEDMDVSAQECEFWQEGHCDCYHCEDRYPHCLDYPNCYFKQLARKTQECDRYRKALEEIETIAEERKDCCFECKAMKKILDIINKAKAIREE